MALLNVAIVNIMMDEQYRTMLTLSTRVVYDRPMTTTARPPARKPRSRYHHGDLRRALLDEAVRTIRQDGVDALTLREAGRRLGVSRTALYRHFRDKSALLAAVARDGFQRFRQDLVDAWIAGGQDRDGFERMGRAYVSFAAANPSHYRVMFGAFSDLCDKDPALQADAAAAFQVLVDAIQTLQAAGEIRADDPQQLAYFIWAAVHGVASLAIDGQLGPDAKARDTLAAFAIERLFTGIAKRSEPRSPGP
jgi:AcrR family transcriptional regulator